MRGGAISGDGARGDAGAHGERGQVPRHDRVGADDRAAADANALQYGDALAEKNVILERYWRNHDPEVPTLPVKRIGEVVVVIDDQASGRHAASRTDRD